jgi:glycosyltransferase involved in cell wall biosynthesis
MPTTVLVDAWHLGGSSANRGIGTYLRAVVPLLAAEPDLRVVGLVERGRTLPQGLQPRYIARWSASRFAQREHDFRLPRDLARAARAEGGDVILSPADNPPRRSPGPWVQMLHDLIPLVVEHPSFDGAARRWRRIGPRLRKARGVCTNSRHTASDARRLLGIESARIHVIPLGVDNCFHPPIVREHAPFPTVLYVGEFGPHKGFAEAFAVAGGIADAGFPHRLAMVGFLAPWYETIVRDLVAQSPRPDRIDLLGFAEDIVTTYQTADALVVTSRYEGFCLPALEAMACGTPVIAFSNSAIPEVVSGGGILVPNGDVEAMVKALAGVLRNPAAWQEISERGIEHARAFRWEPCASALAEVLRAAAEGGPIG